MLSGGSSRGGSLTPFPPQFFLSMRNSPKKLFTHVHSVPFDVLAKVVPNPSLATVAAVFT